MLHKVGAMTGNWIESPFYSGTKLTKKCNAGKVNVREKSKGIHAIDKEKKKYQIKRKNEENTVNSKEYETK